MKNKGFVLMETIVVIVVISVALLTIFSSYNKILTKVKSENKYDTSEYIYMTNYIKEYLKTTYTEDNALIANDIVSMEPEEYSSKINQKDMDMLNIKKIYILTNLDKFDVELSDETKNSKYFDAYMIDYIRKLDVEEDDKLIIVEYRRPALKTDGDGKSDSKLNQLYETYIASLEW